MRYLRGLPTLDAEKGYFHEFFLEIYIVDIDMKM